MMRNKTLETRLDAIWHTLMAQSKASTGMSSASKGAERETFLSQFLSWALQPNLRVSTGDIIDCYGAQSGQVDTIIEYSFMPSLPMTDGGPRLCFAENICASIEIKSNLSGQWNEVISTTNKIKALRRRYGDYDHPLTDGVEEIPMIAVGYKGWKTSETIQEKLNESNIDAIFVIESSIFIGKWRENSIKSNTPAGSFLAFMEFIHRLTNVVGADTDLSNYYLALPP